MKIWYKNKNIKLKTITWYDKASMTISHKRWVNSGNVIKQKKIKNYDK